MSAKGTLEEAGERKRWRRGGCALRAHGDGMCGETGEFGGHEGDIGGQGRGKRWHRGGCALRAHGDGLPGEAGESGEREGDVGGIKGWCRVVKGWRAVK